MIVAMNVASNGQRSPRLLVPDAPDLAKIDQSPCNQEQQRCDHREWQIARQRSDEEQNRDQKQCRADRGERCTRTGHDVDARAVERTAGRIRREERTREVRQPLADELLIAVELVAVRGATARAIATASVSASSVITIVAPNSTRPCRATARATDNGGNAPGSASTVGKRRPLRHILSEQPRSDRRQRDAGEHRRNPAVQRPPRNTAAIVTMPTSGAAAAMLRNCATAARTLSITLAPRGRSRPRNGTDLAVDDQDRRTCSEADDHRVRHEIDQPAGARQSKRQLQRADQKSQRQHQCDI